MPGGIILSNRLARLQQSARDLGDTFEGIRTQQRKTRLEDEDRRVAAEDRITRNKAAATAQEAADLQLGEFKRRDAARQEAEGLAGELAGFGQAVPDSTIATPSDGMLPGFQGMRSERPAVDTSGEALKDRMRAAWMNADARAKGETSAFTAADVKRQRDEAATKKQREAEEYTLGIDKAKADLDRTKAGTKTEEMQQKKLQAELDQLAKGGLDPEKTAAIEGKLRGEFLHQNQSYQGVRDAWSKIQVADASPAGDMSLLYGYMKLLDPTSTVREGEYATAEQAGSVPTRILGMYNKALTGEKLTTEQRADFRKQAKNVFDTQDAQYKKSAKTYLTLATDYGVNPARVVMDLGGPQNPEAPRPSPSASKPVVAGGQDAEAVTWAKANPNDPRAAKILRLNGAR